MACWNSSCGSERSKRKEVVRLKLLTGARFPPGTENRFIPDKRRTLPYLSYAHDLKTRIAPFGAIRLCKKTRMEKKTLLCSAYSHRSSVN